MRRFFASHTIGSARSHAKPLAEFVQGLPAAAL
jgi:hypothetical protein